MKKKWKATIVDLEWVGGIATKAYPKSRTPITQFLTSAASDCDPEEPVVPAWLCKYFERQAK